MLAGTTLMSQPVAGVGQYEAKIVKYGGIELFLGGIGSGMSRGSVHARCESGVLDVACLPVG